MQRAFRYRIVSIVLCTALAAFVALTACSNYDEGERCEVLNGNEDCADGLQCTPKAQINTPYDSSDRCCPVDRTKATHPACVVLTTPITTDAAPLGREHGPDARRDHRLAGRHEHRSRKPAPTPRTRPKAAELSLGAAGPGCLRAPSSSTRRAR